MPLYTIVSRGEFITAKGKPNLKQGDTVEMTVEQAASLPPGTVKLGTVKSAESKAEAPKEK